MQPGRGVTVPEGLGLRNVGDFAFRVDLPLGSTEGAGLTWCRRWGWSWWARCSSPGHWSLSCCDAGSHRFQSPGCHLVDGDADHPEVVVNPGSATDNERPG